MRFSAPASFLFLVLSRLTAQAGEVLTWEACVKEALKNHPDLAASREALRSEQFQHQGSYSGFLPQLSADAGASRANSATSVQSVGGAGVRNDYSLGLSARQSLFSGFKDKAGVERSKAEVEEARASLQETGSGVGFALKSAFSRLLYSQEQLKLTKVIEGRRKENVRLVELRYEAGREHKGSFLRIRAAFKQSEFEVAEAGRSLRVAQRELGRALGRSGFEAVEATGSLKTGIPSGLPDFKSLVLETPAYLRAGAQARAAEKSVTIARGGYYPDLAATGSVSRRGSSWPPDTDRWSLGLSLSFPFFPGGRNIFDVKSAQAEERRAAADFKSAADQAALDLEDSFALYQNAAERTEVQREFLEAAEVRAEIARSQYTSGLLSFEDWDLIENDLISTQKSWLSALRDAAIARAAWERAQGKGLQ